MSLDALVEAIHTTVSPAIIGLTITAIADLERQPGATHQRPPEPTGAVAAAATEPSPERLAAEIARIETSSSRTFRRRYRKLCKQTRELVNRERSLLPRPADVPDDHCGEAYYHDAEAHYANTACGYCLLEVLHDALRQSRCVCDRCNGLRSKHLHYSGACSCAICQISLVQVEFDARRLAAGRSVVPVSEVVVDAPAE